MKTLLLSLIVLFVFSPVYAQTLSDATGLVNRLDIQSAGHTFEIMTVSNFDIYDFDFNLDEKLLTLYISSELENNLGEVIIPSNLLSGNFTFFLNDQEYFPKVSSNEKISFITLIFTGSGHNQLKIFGTTTLSGVSEKPTELVVDVPDDSNYDDSNYDDSNYGGGCLIATATFGTELAPQVQQLRELRENQLLSTDSGTLFVNSFNEFYYSFSPAISDYQRENPIFREIIKLSITPLISSLSLLESVQLNSELKVLVYGTSLILLNIGMYVGIPAIIVIGLKRKFQAKHNSNSFHVILKTN